MSMHARHEQSASGTGLDTADEGRDGRHPLTSLRSQRRVAGLAAVAITGAWGLVTGWWTPRGPLTSSTAIGSILIAWPSAALPVWCCGAGGGWSWHRWCSSPSSS